MDPIKSYSDYLVALSKQTSDLPAVKIEAINALEKLRQNNPNLCEEYHLRFEESKRPKQKLKNDKEEYLRADSEIYLEKLRKNARKKLLRGPNRLGLKAGMPSWITEKVLLSYIDKLSITDLITSSGNMVQRESIHRKCIKMAVADRKIDEILLRNIIINRCRILWDKITSKPDYTFASVKYFILENATIEELANADIDGSLNHSKLYGFIFNKKIKKLTDSEIKEKKQNENDLKAKEKIDRMKQNDNKSQDLRKLANKALNYIDKHNKANDEYPLPDKYKLEDLKTAIEKISDDELLSIYNGKRIDADKLYSKCISILKYEQ